MNHDELIENIVTLIYYLEAIMNTVCTYCLNNDETIHAVI